MANTKVESITRPGTVVAVWTFDSNGNGAAVSVPNALNVTIQTEGNLGGGAMAVTGSNDGTNFRALPTAVSLTVAGLKILAATDRPLFLRPELTGATTPSVTVTLVAAAIGNGG